MASDGSSLQPRRPPHITVNSGSGGNLLDAMRTDSSTSTTVGTPGLSRNLLPQPSSASIYGAPGVAESSEMLLAPGRARGSRPYQDNPDNGSRSASAFSSRRSSWSTDAGSRDSRGFGGPFASPFDDSRAPSRSGSDEDINTQTVAEKFNIMPSAGLLLFPEDVEKDDYLHNPGPEDKEEPKCDIWSTRGLMNVGGLAVITIGVLVLFIGYPVLTFVRQVVGIPDSTICKNNPDCLKDGVPLLKNIRTSLIDPDTPQSEYTRTSNNGDTLKLVFSDEFNKDGRTFYDEDDPYFQGVDIWYGVTEDLEWYDPDALSTANGTLNIKFDAFQSHNLNYRSGMLQSWNKLCFKGGRLEASISLPGRGDISGFWPGFWAMGNLGRPGYAATTEGMWPYSYEDKCDAGITANQSDATGISKLPGMRLPACTCSGEDHPSQGNSRSAPEVDVIEAQVGFMGPGSWTGATGEVSQSFQVAPFDVFYQPDYEYVELYDKQITSMNGYRGGPFQEAFSGVSWLSNDWYDGKAYQKYGFELNPGADGDISWFVGDEYTWKLDGKAVRPNGNIGQRVIPEEPLSVISNFGMSNSFAQVFLANLAETLPAYMRFDYIRIYQKEGEESITCDPPGYPTTAYIKNHPAPYANFNLTNWASTGFDWPKNTLVNGCSM
ncbi:glycoside hydrolase family 16 protein [Bisporella sp. PMI_857]|nr:glycoside hydrolase family 16 protein [Bisporella sp. PMI_857]